MQGSKRSVWKYIIAILAIVVLVALAYGLLGRDGSPKAEDQGQPPPHALTDD